MNIAAVIVAGLLVVIPVIASMTICVPKWWAAQVSPRIPAPIKRLSAWTAPSWARWMLAPLYVCPAILALVVLLVFWYAQTWSAFIKNACPYTRASAAGPGPLWSYVVGFYRDLLDEVRATPTEAP